MIQLVAMQDPVYLDYNATTPIDSAVVDAMLPFLRQHFGNASSAHAYGAQANRALAAARGQVASLIGAHPDEIIFTGGGSETDNLAIKGVVFAALDRQPHVVSCTVEHPAVLATLRYLERRFGVRVTLVPADETGLVDPTAIESALRPETVLVTIMHANNEVGTVEPIEEIGAITRERGIALHVDAAQSAGKIPIDVDRLGVDLLAIAGHKLYGPKGIGALYVRRGTRLDPLIHGSGQELGMRAGTENVAAIVGLGRAAEIAVPEIEHEATRLTALRDTLHRRLQEGIRGVLLNGHPVRRLPNTLNVSLPGAPGYAVLGMCAGVAASTGSACHSGSSEPSPVLRALGLSDERAAGAIRLSLGRWSSEAEIDRAAAELIGAYTLVAGPISPVVGG